MQFCFCFPLPVGFSILSCEKWYRWWRRYWVHKLKALQICKAALADKNVFEDFVGCDWLHFKITVNWNG